MHSKFICAVACVSSLFHGVNNVPVCLFMKLLKDSWVVCSFQWLWMKLLWIFVYRLGCACRFSFNSGKEPGVRSLGRMLSICLTLEETIKMFSKWLCPFASPSWTSSVELCFSQRHSPRLNQVENGPEVPHSVGTSAGDIFSERVNWKNICLSKGDGETNGWSWLWLRMEREKTFPWAPSVRSEPKFLLLTWSRNLKLRIYFKVVPGESCSQVSSTHTQKI